MAYRQFNLTLWWHLARVVLLATAFGAALGFSWRIEFLIILLAAMLWFVFRFIGFLSQTHRKLHYFIRAVKNEDTSLLFPGKTGSPMLDELHQSLNELNAVVQEKSIRNRMNERYLSEILHHIATAVFVFNKKGFVINCNRATLDLFGLHTFTHLRQLEKVNESLPSLVEHIGDYNGRSFIMKRGTDTLQLSVRSSLVSLRDETVTLVTLQDIRVELERRELDSWVKLIKVLNHEIMNSLTPVTSIAQSLEEIWQKHKLQQPDSLEVNQTVNGLQVIAERGEALMRFVQSYRIFTRMPDVKPSQVGMCDFFDRLSILTSPLKETYTIEFIAPEEDFSVKMDEQLMVQVVINLVKNAVQALNGSADSKVVVSCKPLEGHYAEISVKDNGCGIPEEIKEEIFVPFFTTRSEGTGIGLSYSRQIVRAHGGTLGFYSRQGETVFFVRW